MLLIKFMCKYDASFYQGALMATFHKDLKVNIKGRFNGKELISFFFFNLCELDLEINKQVHENTYSGF